MSLNEGLESAYEQCESPIERAVLLALFADGVAWHERECGRPVVPQMGPIAPEPFGKCRVWIQHQARIGQYRADFLVSVYYSDVLDTDDDNYVEITWQRGSIVVECDGHDYHERTKEQASRDKRRDREMQSDGYVVFRYTGSNIWNDCMTVAREVLDAAYDMAQSRAEMVERTLIRGPNAAPESMTPERIGGLVGNSQGQEA